jgi:hypothetical protein
VKKSCIQSTINYCDLDKYIIITRFGILHKNIPVFVVIKNFCTKKNSLKKLRWLLVLNTQEKSLLLVS